MNYKEELEKHGYTVVIKRRIEKTLSYDRYVAESFCDGESYTNESKYEIDDSVVFKYWCKFFDLLEDEEKDHNLRDYNIGGMDGSY